MTLSLIFILLAIPGFAYICFRWSSNSFLNVCLKGYFGGMAIVALFLALNHFFPGATA